MTAGRRTRLVAVVVLLAFTCGTAAVASWRDLPEPAGAAIAAPTDGRPDAESLTPRTAELRAPAALERSLDARLMVAAVLAAALVLLVGLRRAGSTARIAGPPPTRLRRHSLALRAPPLVPLSTRPC